MLAGQLWREQMNATSTTEVYQHTDPVCDMTVSDNSEFSYLLEDIKYFFCSEHCLQKFKKTPDEYLHKKTAPPLAIEREADTLQNYTTGVANILQSDTR
jgi:YHS domain-containing protein